MHRLACASYLPLERLVNIDSAELKLNLENQYVVQCKFNPI